MNGDHRADLVQWNDDDVKVYLSTGTAFKAASTWSSRAGFYGSEASLVADADGDGKSDLVVWSSDGISVALSTGTSFGIEFGMAYEVSPEGKITRTETLTPASFKTELPPPPVVRPRPFDLPPPPLPKE